MMVGISRNQRRTWLSPFSLYRSAAFPFEELIAPWLLFMLMVTATSTAISVMNANNYPRFETKTALLYAYYYRSVQNGLRESLIGWSAPLPNHTVGRLGWYRHGLQEVRKNREFIESLLSDEVPAVLLAAAIANQGNSVQRPFGWDGLERVQTWLGMRFDWRLTQWQWGEQRWEAHFEQRSVGIGQIQPYEARHFGYAGDRMDLFDDRVSIGLMQAKMAATNDALGDLDVSYTDRFALMAVGNNHGTSIAYNYAANGNDLQRLFAHDESARRQLAKMLTYIHYLHDDGWPLPEGVNLDHLWWLVRNAHNAP